MADETSVVAPSGDALVIHGSTKGVEVRASEDGLYGIINAFERIWVFSLNWVTANPILGVVFFLVVAFLVWQALLTRVQVEALKTDYKQARQRARPAPKNRRVK